MSANKPADQHDARPDVIEIAVDPECVIIWNGEVVTESEALRRISALNATKKQPDDRKD
jgi:hypothetical protein